MKARFDSELLRTFVSIAETGSFTRAADLVGRTQSAVSMQVKRLEDVAGATLFVRNARGVALTPLGESLLTDARRIIRLLDQAAEALHPNALEGSVSVGIPEEYGTTILPQILARFAETHARVEVTVTCEPSLALQAALERGDLDLAVTVVDDGRTQGEILLHDPTVWVTSSRHLAHEQDPLPVAMFARGCWWRDWALKALDDRRLRYRIAYSSASVAGVQAAVKSGLAVAVLGHSMIPEGTRMLATWDGFASLPGSNVVLRQRQRAAAQPVAGMAAAIRDAFRAVRPPA